MKLDIDAAPSGGSAATAYRVVYDSPIGRMAMDGDDRSITHLFLPCTGPAQSASSTGPMPEPLRQASEQLDEYFAGERTAFGLPFDLRGTSFQVEVWRALADIPYGTTITYGELARNVGRPSAFRAVGQANGRNPLPIFFPCHRVVASDGIGGYGGGLDVKRRLLALEGWRG